EPRELTTRRTPAITVRMNFRRLVPLFLILALCPAAASAAPAVDPIAPAAPSGPVSRPNIIFIMSDDHAAHAISCYGSKVNQTPNLDRIAASGMKFTQAFVTNSICTPSRATLLTGKYSHLNGSPVFNRFDGAQPHVARMLQAGGYHTAMVGKWHLGSAPTGFDRWLVLPGQGLYRDPAFLTPAGQLKVEGYASDVITDLAIRTLEDRPRDRPFFLMLHHKAPHRAWEPDEKNRALFKDRVIPLPTTFSDDYHSRPGALPQNRQTIARDLTRRDLKLVPPPALTPAERQAWLGTAPQSVDVPQPDGSLTTLTGDALTQWKYQRYMQDYLACVQGVDDNVGRLLDYLDTSKLAENTVVLYTSDNGFFLGDDGLFDKRFMYEPSLRIPLLVRAPGLAAPASVSARMVINTDFAPTFLDLAGIPIPTDMQGSSLKPLLTGNPSDNWRKSMYYRYYHDPGDHNTAAHLGIRTETEKLIHFWKLDTWEYYDLAADPSEQNNRIQDPAAAPRIEALRTELKRLQATLGDTGQFSESIPPSSVDGMPTGIKRLGLKTIAEACAAGKDG
ncbi:MAG: betC 1, partial [Verrucomicrobiales bacterium]|nr:betC 1 [Verrucomicrobiales bacterium]